MISTSNYTATFCAWLDWNHPVTQFIWLECCRLFPLSRCGSANRHPPPHCGSPEHIPTHLQPAPRRRTSSGRFMDTINPLMSFSSEDIANMDREVEDIFNESESEGEPDNKVSEQHKMGRSQVQNLDTADESSSSSADTWSVENSTDTGRFRQWKMARSTVGCYSECFMFSQILSEQGSIMFLHLGTVL